MNGIDERGDAETTLEFEEGRYLYCAVYADADESFSAEGIEGEPVSLVVEDGIGAVVQPVDSVYDSDDLTQVRKWLLSHQQVVDDAGRAFGTPLPFRFDTILKGGDETVSGWLEDHYEEIDDALEWLSGRWAYRVELRWDEEVVAEEVREADDEIRELSAEIESASEGTGFLLEKQYGKRLDRLLEDRRESLESELYDRIEPHAVDVRRSGGETDRFSTDDDGEFETVVQLSVLADADQEEAIGEALESFAERPAYEVRYTGPWPPYSFAPRIGDGDDGSDGGDGDA